MKISIVSRTIVISGACFILLLKTFIRPEFTGMHTGTTYMMGITPNLLGSFLLPVGLFMFPKTFAHTYNAVSLRWFSMLAFLLLCFNETLQLIPVFGRTFDLNDIMASAVGLSCSLMFVQQFFMNKALAKTA